MKRLLLRISVLGIVIALGLIAIAQAQRSSAQVASPAPATPPTSYAPVDAQVPESNPLRSPASPQTSDIGGVGSSGISPGVPANQPTLAAPTDRFSFTAATNTGMTPPTMAAGPTPAEPMPNLGSFPAAQPTPAVPPQMVGTAAIGSNSNTLGTQGSYLPPEDYELPPASASSPPVLAEAGAPSVNPTLAGSFPPEANQIPHQLDGSEARPMNPAAVPAPFANSPIPSGSLAGAQMATGTGRPGAKQLEGAQAPQLVIEKIAPAEIQVGRPAIFELHVRNVGTLAASNVEIRDEIPKGTRLQSTKPQASQGAQGGLVWKLGTLNPNEDAVVEMELMPIDEGEIGSVATVHFQTDASVRTRATRPQLAIEIETARQVLKGKELALKITVSNPGTGIAENVILEEHVPHGFRHPAGAELEYEVGDLAPNESHELTLILEAVTPGSLENVITARGEPSLRTENRREVEVIAPQLEVSVTGPAKRFLEREAVYNLSVSNPGTAPAKHVELAVEVPAGMSYVSGSNQAFYEETTRTVHWMLEEIPVQDGPPPVQLTLMPVEAGDHRIRLVSSDDSGATAEVEQAVHVEGIVAMYFEVADLQDPIEVGGQTVYEIRVVNQGTKEATNVRLGAELPPEMRAVAAEGPTQQAQASQANVILFHPLQRLAAKADVTYRIRVEGVRPGDLRMRVQVTTDEIQQPITKEESTRVYSDQ